MKRSNIISLLILMLSMPFVSKADMGGDWKLHPTFHSNIAKVFDTPDVTYMLAYAQPYLPDDAKGLYYNYPYGFLYCYDKQADELTSLNYTNRLSDDIIVHTEYNPDKKYLLVIYDDFNIDLVYDSGKVVNIPGIMNSSIPGKKDINSVTFDPSSDRVYLATDFGYVILNDKKGEIADSRNLGVEITAVTLYGTDLVLAKDNMLYSSPLNAPNFTFSEFTPLLSFKAPVRFLPLDNNRIVVVDKQDKVYNYYLISTSDNKPKELLKTAIYDISANRDGYVINDNSTLTQLKKDGNLTTILKEETDNGLMVSSWDFKEFWMAKPLTGLFSRSFTQNPDKWTLTRGDIRPDAPATFISTSMKYVPGYGLATTNHTIDWNFSVTHVNESLLLSFYQNGRWKQAGVPYCLPDYPKMLTGPAGIYYDSQDPGNFYFGSFLNGIVRLNVEDPKKTLHLGSSATNHRYTPGFVEMAQPQPEWNTICKFSAIEPDASNNIWSGHYNLGKAEFWYWTPEDRKASTSPATFRPWKKIKTDLPASSKMFILPLKTSSNRNFIVGTDGNYNGNIFIYDHNGTPESTSDDKKVIFSDPLDQDGNNAGQEYLYTFYEDPSTGLIWVGGSNGPFTINPKNAFSTNAYVNRIKVARNDGTNLADYLLDGIRVTAITDDTLGRKWFGTLGAGVVCTSSDGREILGEFTTDNSPLPSDDVYSLAWNPENSSIMISTGKGLIEYFPAGEGATGADFESIRAYPNPVRPDYYGYVTIDGLVNNAYVKITDSAGNLVKDLGLAAGGSIQWDITNLNMKRVASGVYHVVVSSSEEGNGMAKVTKVLVMN